MSGKGAFRDLTKRLAKFGYEDTGERSGSGSLWIFECAGGDQISISPSLTENTARQIVRDLERRFKTGGPVAKRKPSQIRDRQQAEREHQQAELARIDAERDAIAQERATTVAEARDMHALRQFEVRLAELDAERHEIELLMSAGPLGEQRVRHRA